jgi:predicted permease
MPLGARLRSLSRNLFRPHRSERLLDEELRLYVDLLAAEYKRAGMSPADARRRAVVETGGLEQVKEATRDVRTGHRMVTLSRELRYALRVLRRSPGFVTTAVATLAIGIGGATAVFTVIKASLLRPLPAVAEPDRLVTIERVQGTVTVAEFSYADFRDLAARSTTLRGLAGFNGGPMTLANESSTAREWVSVVTNDFFTVLGVPPAAGRFFRGEEPAPVVVLGHDLWQRRFGGAPNMIGSNVTLDGHPHTVVGIAPRGFIGAMATHEMEAWIPMTANGRASATLTGLDLESRRSGFLRLVGRLETGKTVADARTELQAIAAWLAATYATNRGRGVTVWKGAGMTAEERDELERVPLLLAMAVGLLLLIACVNIANLSLVRVSARRRELATRIALGASRAALVRQVAIEGAIVAVAAAALGIVIAQLLVRSSTLVESVVSFSQMDLRIDLRVLGVAVAACTLTAIVISLVPAVHIARLAPGAVLKDGGGAIRRRARTQRALVATQVAASLVLLSAAATMFGTFQRVLAAHAGFDPRGIIDARLEVDEWSRDTTRQMAFYRAVLARAVLEPEIAGAALSTTVPPFQWSSTVSVFRRGEEPTPGALTGRELELGLRTNVHRVSETFFDVMRIPLLRGRTFNDTDDERSDPVVIVSRRVADELWPGQDPIDRWIAWPAVEGRARAPLRVVGVVADTRDAALAGEPPLAMYLSIEQRPGGNHLLVLRGRGMGAPSASELRRVVAAVNSSVTVLGGRTLIDRLGDVVRPQQRASAGIAVFGAIALILASIGLYGIVAQGVLYRRRELAVRSALGATPRGIYATVFGDGLRPAVVGAIAGAIASAASIPVLRSMFNGVDTSDLRLAIVGLVVLALATLAATYVPARRASRLNPADALRID